MSEGPFVRGGMVGGPTSYEPPSQSYGRAEPLSGANDWGSLNESVQQRPSYPAGRRGSAGDRRGAVEPRGMSAAAAAVVAMEDQQFNPAKLFVGGLGQQTTEASLSAYFSRFGSIKDSVVITDRATGRSRGFGFVVFEEHASVDACLHGRHNVDGVSCEVRRAVPRDEARSTTAPAPGVGDQLGKIYVGGLSETCSEQKARDYFSRFGPIRNVTLMYDRVSHRPRGFGFIVFENYADAQKAWGSHPELGRMVEAKKAEPRPELRRGGVGGSERRSHSPSGGGANAKRWGGGYENGGNYQSGRHPSPYGGAVDSRDSFAPPLSAGGWAAPVEPVPSYKAEARVAPQPQPAAAAADPYSSLTCTYASQPPATSASFTTAPTSDYDPYSYGSSSQRTSYGMVAQHANPYGAYASLSNPMPMTVSTPYHQYDARGDTTGLSPRSLESSTRTMTPSPYEVASGDGPANQLPPYSPAGGYESLYQHSAPAALKGSALLQYGSFDKDISSAYEPAAKSYGSIRQRRSTPY